MVRTDWNRALDTFITTGTLTSKDYQTMNTEQQYVIIELRKAYKRVNK